MRHRFALSLAALLVPILWHGSAATAQAVPPVHDCDRLAGDPFAPDKIVAGVRWNQLDPAKAVPVCAAAVHDFPDVARFALQYARALTKAEKYADAGTYWHKFADEGHPIAQYNVGFFFAEGKGSFSKDEAEAVRWFKKAAEQGYPPAQSYLGTMYAQGRGVSPDYSTAMGWFRKAAEQGEPTSQTWLGVIYAQGLGGVSQDHAEAAKWLQKAAEQGEPPAENWLGWLYENGHGVTQDRAEARKWYQKAAEQGLAEAQTALARLDPATSGTASPKSVEPPVHDCDRFAASPYDSRAVAPVVSEADIDAQRAIRACRAALDEFPNTPRFQAQLGRALYEAGQHEKAVASWRDAAEQGYGYGMFALGAMYQAGTRGAAGRCSSGRLVSHGGRAGKCCSAARPRLDLPGRTRGAAGLCAGGGLVPQGGRAWRRCREGRARRSRILGSGRRQKVGRDRCPCDQPICLSR